MSPARPRRGAEALSAPGTLMGSAVEEELARRAPLASRLRPSVLDEVVGQRHLLGPGAPLRALIEADRVSSAVFYGPPGTGKTTVARLVASTTRRRFRALSAVEAGVKEVRAELEGAREALATDGTGTILFLDEVHRFNKAQQDSLLHGVEDGVVCLVGATTENPFFSLNTPLLSRSALFRFEPLEDADVRVLVDKALAHEAVSADGEAVGLLVDLASGDARVALTALEAAIALAGPGGHVTLGHAEGARASRAFRHGRDEHYDLVSALIKSLRGSDPDAGLYWLARLLEVGDDPRFVARRLVVLASEDVGLADPMSLVVASAAAQAVELVGLPEASLNLAQAVVHLALAEKSNSTARGLWRAEERVRSGPFAPVPAKLRDAHYGGAAKLGHGAGYEYPHDYPRGYVEQQYLPDELVGERFFEPGENGFEGRIVRAWQERRGGGRERSDE